MVIKREDDRAADVLVPLIENGLKDLSDNAQAFFKRLYPNDIKSYDIEVLQRMMFQIENTKKINNKTKEL